MWSACLRHVHELHIKRASESVFGPTTGPTDKMFKELRDNWNDLKDKIDVSLLNGFNWEEHRGTFLEEAIDALNFCRKALVNGSFHVRIIGSLWSWF